MKKVSVKARVGDFRWPSTILYGLSFAILVVCVTCGDSTTTPEIIIASSTKTTTNTSTTTTTTTSSPSSPVFTSSTAEPLPQSPRSASTGITASHRLKVYCRVNETLTLNIGESYHVGCEKTCTCTQEALLDCKQRCSESKKTNLTTSVNCEQIPDERDAECCTRIRCTEKLLVEKVRVSQNEISIRWRAPTQSSKDPHSGLHIPNLMVSYRLVSSSGGKDTETHAWSTANIKLGMPTNDKMKTALIEDLMPSSTYAILVEDSGINETITLTTKAGCIHNSTLMSVDQKYTVGCDEVCICTPSGKVECKDRCTHKVGGQMTNSSCSHVPDPTDPDCCLQIICKNEDMSTPKVLVTQRNATSLTIAWDDFRLPNYKSGYVVEYRPVANFSSEEWIRLQANNTPFLTISSLRPHSAYQIRVLVWEDDDAKKTLGSSSEIITALTEDGCLRNGSVYSLGEEFFEGCDLRCTCRGADEGECSDRCVQPYFRAGMMKNEPQCIEEPAPNDACCAQCSPKIHLKTKSDLPEFTDKPGVCPTTSHLPAMNPCPQDCNHDYHCKGAQKCCQVNCGGTVCLDPIPPSTSCANIKCGPNAACEPSSGTCKCNTNHTGDPTDKMHGCSLDKKQHLCTFKNETYAQMQEFFDGCESKCVCSEALEIECSPRCLPPTPNPDSLSYRPKCSIKEDPKDSCCKIVVCEQGIVELSPTGANETSARNNEHFADTVNVNMPKVTTGCHHNGKTYGVNESFNEGCESSCKCKDGGHLQCQPRCPTFQGNDKKFCQLIPDPDDPECCKIAVCDVKEGARHDNPSIVLDSAEPFNSTVVRLRIVFPKKLNMTGKPKLKLLFAKVKTETMTETENLNLNWETRKLTDEVHQIVDNGKAFEINVANLHHSTEYFMKVANEEDESTSNTVVVRTFPHGIDASFNGCFHGNKTYEIGQTFYDGCEYRCVCRESGIRECEERCPVYIDTVGYENCEWGPSPDDTCCTIPLCNEAPKISKHGEDEPESEPFCVDKSGQVHLVEQSWEEGEGCLKRRCKCIKSQSGNTTEECKGGCATIPPTALKPTLECHQPELVRPNDPCLCPYVICNQNNNPIAPPPPPIPGRGQPNLFHPKMHKEQSLMPKRFCEFNGRRIPIGEEFHDGCRAVCHCGNDARVNCGVIECPHHFAPHMSECLEWEVDPDFVPKPPECCPPPKCKNDGSCQFGGLKFANMKQIPSELLPCGTTCVCLHGNITCENRCPILTDIPPTNLPCLPSMAYKTHIPGDDCCQHWTCRGTEKQAVCLHNGRRYKVGEQWEDPSTANVISSRRRCSCKSTGASKPVVQCYPGMCPPITERHIQPSPECPIPVIVTPEDPIMCPYVACNYTEEAGSNKVNGKELEHVSLVALNSTAVRVRFTLPSLLVGLVGHAELYYTTDPLLPITQWSIQKFARPKRLFDTPNIEYHLGSLRPGTDYYFQIHIVIEALQTGPESDVYKLHLPELPTTITTVSTMTTATTTTTTTPTTTTLPPVIVLDMHLNAKPVDMSVVKVSWRNLVPQEKKYVDGLQIKYKMLDQTDDKWLTSPIIHRDVTSFTLRDLNPGSAYSVDLSFKVSEGLTTSVNSAKATTVKLPPKPKDLFEFPINVDPNQDLNAESSKILVQLKTVPHPVQKYINLVKLSYKNLDSSNSIQPKHVFKVPSSDGLVAFEGLEPMHKYKAWLDIFLSNGKVKTSNSFEFATKAGKPGQRTDEASANEAEALRESHTNEAEIIRPYYIALLVITLFAVVTGIGFVAMLCVLLRTKSSAEAAITRAPSESAYDNPTYKTYDGEKPIDEQIKNGTVPA